MVSRNWLSLSIEPLASEAKGMMEQMEKEMSSSIELTAKMEPFDSFWEGPENVEKGYASFYQFYKHNYLRYFPERKDCSVLVVSCGPGYFVNTLAPNLVE